MTYTAFATGRALRLEHVNVFLALRRYSNPFARNILVWLSQQAKFRKSAALVTLKIFLEQLERVDQESRCCLYMGRGICRHSHRPICVFRLPRRIGRNTQRNPT